MEKHIMKIKRLVVKNLYGHVCYDIKFNDNVTFLYGDNGCGKTTILNIVTYIITGKIYKLFDYNFEQITLSFSGEGVKAHQQIVLHQSEQNVILVDFMSECATINRRVEYVATPSAGREDIDRFYFSEYPVLERIQNIFNYVYLPLSRNSTLRLDYPYL